MSRPAPAVASPPVPLVVQKFGGTSVADPERIREVADHVARTKRRGDDVVVVVSAMGKETDELIRLAAEVSKVRPGREMDMLITAGERKATALLCMALHDLGVPADSFTGSQAGFITDGTHTNAKIVELRPDRLRGGARATATCRWSAARRACRGERNVTFLGRGGSDTTAVALAHALGADSCELYTDVPGRVHRRPPARARPRAAWRTVSFDEMLEMTACGCPKPAMRSVEFARTWGVRLHVRSAFTWEPGTWVQEEDPSMEQAIVSAVVHDTSEAKVTVAGVPDQPGIAARLFRLLADADVNVDMIVQNTSRPRRHRHLASPCPTTTSPQSQEITAVARRRDPAPPASRTDDGIARVSLVGAGMKSNPGVAATIFETLAAGRHQHRDDLHLRHPHLLHRPRGPGRAGRPGPPHRLRPVASAALCRQHRIRC